jgi:hypothetical protein
MKETPTLIYGMTPGGEPYKSLFKSFFETGPVKELLERPGELRYAGWDLQTLDSARIVKGAYLEVKNGERKIIRLYEDGSLIAGVGADQGFLGWARSEAEFKQKPRLNPVALTEFSYNFVNLCSKLIKLLEPFPETVILRVEIRNAFFEGSRLYVSPYPIGTYGFLSDSGQYTAQESSMRREIEVPSEGLASRPEAVAFLLVERIYTWFGVPSDKIPYVSSDGHEKFVDAKRIAAIKS